MQMLLFFHSGAIGGKIRRSGKPPCIFWEAIKDKDVSGIACQGNS